MQRSAGFTGEENGVFSGNSSGSVLSYSYAVQGNLLTGPEVVQAMSMAFEVEACDLAERLMASLEAGGAQGGDSRCVQSGADGSFLQVDRDGEPAGSDLSLKVDNVDAPIAELRRRFDNWRIHRSGAER